MRARGRTNRPTAAFWLAVLALLLLALIPGGLMPAKSWNGLDSLLVPCPGAASMVAAQPHDQGPDSEKRAPSAGTVTCAFAGLTASYLPHEPAPAFVPPAAAHLVHVDLTTAGPAAAARMSSPPPPSQAPPSDTV